MTTDAAAIPAPAAAPTQAEIDANNAAFWNEMCGSTAAKMLGVTGNDSASLAKFDRWFFELYPYLDRFIDCASLAGKDVLEVGLGYGSVAQRIAEADARYRGLDIAAGPVAGVNHRMAQACLDGQATQGSILAAPFDDASFDAVVAIGCYHHTGDLARAIVETARLLRPGGRAVIMVYNALSYLHWLKQPARTLAYAWRDLLRGSAAPLDLSAAERGAFDADTAGRVAPETVLVSKRHLARLLRPHFGAVRIERTNVGHRLSRFIPRRWLLATVAPWCGLDLYARVTK